MASRLLDVMTFNVEGLPWPARSGRSASLKAIGEHIRDLRHRGKAPDVILFQEAFARPATRMVEATGYPTIVPGPGHRARSTVPRGGTRRPGARVWGKGEVGLKFLGSGLAIVSEYPVTDSFVSAFARKSCAGIDCLSNKGMVLARLHIPGVPAPVELLTTHMNSQRASRVPSRRYNAVHLAQTNELQAFIGMNSDLSAPLIFGGDFNMRHEQLRFDHFERKVAMKLVHRECGAFPERCDVRMSWDGDAPWMDTQDLQLYSDGAAVQVEPIRVEAWFDGPEKGGRLSDHDAYRVVYRLSWPKTAAPYVPDCGG
ncbi:endonuclease/exonuclease/phosphatase family protein [Sphingomonas sp. C3-2]|uniref:endonuclease/exonuclease/phosphatase family protein n=1 Tax=Sphingomonas sp. C3-2 TaxID=3062169 RepID=UPI00294B258C|nr:endonuclease/exonuclease/phosphatase family protein [Sphingomonas sp. C3-2]WOK36655.1 endonuclease/exonuclease/phosphatase family protein [Sphingomonas sp. C3-2]